jgi:hypothetical protein
MLDALLLGGERFEQGLNRGAVGMLSGLAALQVGLNLREISVEGSCHRIMDPENWTPKRPEIR